MSVVATAGGACLRGGPLAAALRDPACYPHPVEDVRVVETHISWVFLAGPYAYKVKKPVRLDFLDFTGLDARHFFCDEELRLNRRTAPDLYLDVVPIAGTPSRPIVGGGGVPIEFAVRMRRFAQEDLLSRRAQAGALDAATIDALAGAVAQMHTGAPTAATASFGTPGIILAQALDNFSTLERIDPAVADLHLARWARLEHSALVDAFAARRREGFVREVHGDLHLGNVVLLDGVPTPFDCIEFDPKLRCIDVMSDVAFTYMDLLSRGQVRPAAHFVNAWLERTGDYAGLRVLRFYAGYRAMVRAKIAGIRAHQDGIDADGRREATESLRLHLALARRLAVRRRAALILMHGPSGSGKTTVAQELVESLGAVRLRSDVERKRLRGLAPLARSASGLRQGLYDAAATQGTYGRLAILARESLAAGYRTVVDATFLRRGQRDAFRALAHALGVPFAIVSCEAPASVLRERLERRRPGTDASEADVAVLEAQQAEREPFAPEESGDVIVANATRRDCACEASDAMLARLFGRAA